MQDAPAMNVGMQKSDLKSRKRSKHKFGCPSFVYGLAAMSHMHRCVRYPLAYWLHRVTEITFRMRASR